MIEAQMESLNPAVEERAETYPDASLLMAQPGVGEVTGLAFIPTMGGASRFAAGAAGAYTTLQEGPVALPEPWNLIT
jgi:transposase